MSKVHSSTLNMALLVVSLRADSWFFFRLVAFSLVCEKECKVVLVCEKDVGVWK